MKRTYRRASRVLTIGVVLALLVAACGAGEESVSDDGPAPAAPSSGDGDQGAPDAEPAILRVAVASFGNESLDPATENRQQNISVNFVMFDTLTDIGPDGGLVPGVATDWELGADGLSWTFNLRDDVVFHDGTPMTAEDVKFSIERMQREEASAASATQARVTIDTVEVIDDYTIRITTNGPQPDLPMILSPHSSEFPILPQEYILSNAGDDFDAQTALLNSAPIGSGSFQFVSRVAGDSYTFAAVENHWRATPEFSEVQFVLVPEAATQVAMLRTNEVDLIQVNADELPGLVGAGYQSHFVHEAIQVGVFWLGTYRGPAEGKPTADARVRRALSLAIDRQPIMDALEGGDASFMSTPWNTLPATRGIDASRYQDWAAEANRFSPDEARELLAEAGYPNGFADTTFHTWVHAGVTYLPDLAQIVAEQWRAVGVEVDLNVTDYGTFRPHYVRADPDDAFNAAEPNTFANSPRFLASDVLATHYRYENGSAQFVRSDEMDALLLEMENETDPARRQELMDEAFDRAHAEWVILPLYTAPIRYASNPEVIGELPTIDGWAFFSRVIERATRP